MFRWNPESVLDARPTWFFRRSVVQIAQFAQNINPACPALPEPGVDGGAIDMLVHAVIVSRGRRTIPFRRRRIDPCPIRAAPCPWRRCEKSMESAEAGAASAMHARRAKPHMDVA